MLLTKWIREETATKNSGNTEECEYEYISQQNLWDTVKGIERGKFTHIYICSYQEKKKRSEFITKQHKSSRNQKWHTDEQLKTGRTKEIIKIRANFINWN